MFDYGDSARCRYTSVKHHESHPLQERARLSAIEAGTVIDGRYRVSARLGSGGMADVYLAHDTLLGRQVALKLLHHRFAEDQEFVERFRREASALPAYRIPTLSPCSTGASGTAPTTSPWSICPGAR